MNYIYNDITTKNETINSLHVSSNGQIWETAFSNEWDRLVQGNKHSVTYTDSINFIPITQVPQEHDVMYVSFVCDHRPLKFELWWVQIKVWGDHLIYNDNSGSPAASLLETKILLNSVISDAKRGAWFMSLDLKDYFLATPMHRPEYMRVPLKYFSSDIQKKLASIVTHDNLVHVCIKKGMYSLLSMCWWFWGKNFQQKWT